MRRSAVVVLAIVLAACGWDWTVVPKESAGGGACKSNDECAPDEVCLFGDLRCGAGAAGKCVPTPGKCEADPPDVVCGCDGKTAANRCALEATRVDVSPDVACTAPPDTFRCGFLFCGRDTFCFEVAQPDLRDYVCIPWLCDEKNCSCSETTSKCKTATCSEEAGVTRVVCTE